MAVFSEQEIQPHIAEGIEDSVSEGAFLIHLSVEDCPAELVGGVDRFVFEWCGGKQSLPSGFEAEDIPYSLGALWGKQMAREFGWEWRYVSELGQEGKGPIGVVSPDRALVIYPFHYIIDCLPVPNADPTILLAFNMLKAGKHEGQRPRTYTNVMKSVHRIVPRPPYRSQ